MKSFDYEAVTFDGAVYCVGKCFDAMAAGFREHQRPTLESDEVSAIFADSEWDSYPVCDICHAAHEYVCLTVDGQARTDDAIDTMLASYIETALWSSTDNADDSGGATPLDDNYSDDDIADDTRAAMRKDCAAFLEENASDINGKWASAGHNFWLTRNGHGAGFWDSSDFPGAVGERLTKASKPYGTSDLMIGDDGKIHAS